MDHTQECMHFFILLYVYIQKVISLCLRRGFIYQNGSQFSPVRGCYDYGPLGAQLKNNIAASWYSMLYVHVLYQYALHVYMHTIKHPKREREHKCV